MSQQHIKTFISYSWTSPEHQNWVIELATKLRSNGIDVILDVWDLKEGQDKYCFMEKMVTDESVKKVIIISDAKYSEKANIRSGGVGTESQIISNEIYNKVEQTKFIPVVVEYYNKVACLPVFLKSSIYIDLSSDTNANEYEKLLRAIYDKPLHKKPNLGTTPSFLIDSLEPVVSTTGIFELLKVNIKNGKQNTKALFIDFIELFMNEIKSHVIIEFKNGDHDEEIFQSIEALKPLSEQFKIINSELLKNDIFFTEEIILFFENCLNLYDGTDKITSCYEYQFDNIKFLTRELFLILLTELKIRNKFEIINQIIENYYFINTRLKAENQRCYEICANLSALDQQRNTRLNLKRLCITADLLKERYTSFSGNFNAMIETDYLLWFRAMKDNHYWFPVTMVYLGRFSSSLEIFKRSESIIYFNNIKNLLKVDNKEKLIEFIEYLKKNHRLDGWRVSGSWDSLPLIAVLNLDKIATLQ